jgi:predicted HNH restriction endonuclease
MNREDVLHKEYYSTPHWKQLVKSIVNAPDAVCELCLTPRWTHFKRKAGSKITRRFTLHHKHYNTLGKEKRTDVMCLCSDCHNMAHAILRRRRDSVWIADLQDTVLEHFIFEQDSYSKARRLAKDDK